MTVFSARVDSSEVLNWKRQTTVKYLELHRELIYSSFFIIIIIYINITIVIIVITVITVNGVISEDWLGPFWKEKKMGLAISILKRKTLDQPFLPRCDAPVSIGQYENLGEKLGKEKKRICWGSNIWNVEHHQKYHKRYCF